ncbi:MAG: excinuclease ABC subunit UvrA [Bacteroidales bacterium]|nr:excinuclease ABC subunit UvrA [Bacteroidales bacterium]MDY2935899.1 excinuclease ABC subunit UvrA [Candidatus Cryptobacteroides sp.]
MMPIKCPVCGEEFYGPGAEAMAFNSDGACPTCQGTGIVREIDDSTLVPDERLSIQDGAVLPWKLFGLVAMPQTVAELGVRIDVPFSELTEEERRIVFEGEETKRMIAYHSKNGKVFELNCVYINAHRAVEQALKNADSEKGLDKVRKFLHEATCPDCHGTRLSAQVRSTTLAGKNLAEATAMTLDELLPWVHDVPDTLPEAMRPMARNIIESFLDNAKRLKDLGLGYLSLDRASNTLSTGERQRVQLARAVRNETTGVLYVLDEPSIGLHPSNIDGLMEVVDSLIADGNSVVMVDHDVRVLRRADHMIEMGPMAGSKGGTIIAQGTVDEVSNTKGSVIAPFLTGKADVLCRQRTNREQMFDLGRIHLSTSPLHTVHALDVSFPKGRLITVTGVSGSGKTTMILECLIPAITALCAGRHLPSCVKSIEADGISRINLIDASPIGDNVRSTVATYSGVLDDLRQLFATTPAAKYKSLKPGAFSYNTGSLRCPTCDGTGQISLDVQFLPDVTISCPDCDGKRYSAEAAEVVWTPKGANHSYSLPDLLAMTVSDVRELFRDNKKIGGELQILEDLGLGYLTLGEGTPALSGGEAQRLKLASEMGRTQEDSVFVFDEPTIGLHPLDVQVLLGVFSHLVDNGATVIVIEHDLDVIANSDYLIDMGPGGGYQGGRIVAQGTPEELASNPSSLTGKYLKEKMIQG